MEKDEILKVLQEREDTTVLSFPQRGPWGSNSYRGNCTGWIPAYFIWKYGVKKLAEIFAGSGTTYDVCKDFGINYTGLDLNPNPTRPGIISQNILDESIELPAGFYDADMVFLHPPYPSIHEVKYANNMWKDTENLSRYDIQNMTWKKGMQAVNKSILRGYAAMQPGAYEVILVGEIRSKGQYRSMYQNLTLPGILHQTFIKLQHNCVSNGRNYGKSDFALTGHEMIAVIKKPSGYEIAYVIPKVVKKDIRNCKMATWSDLVMAAARQMKGAFKTHQIFDELCHCEKAKNNNYLAAKIRQVLQYLAKKELIKHIDTSTWIVVV